MNTFDDKFGKGSLDKLREGASVDGWENVTVVESTPPGRLYLKWEGTKGTAKAMINWGPEIIEWYRMVVDPPRSGFLSGLILNLTPVLLEMGITHERILGGGDPAFAAVGFEEVHDEQHDIPHLILDMKRVFEYEEFKAGKKTPKWRNEE